MNNSLAEYEERYPRIWFWGSEEYNRLRFVVTDDVVYVRMFTAPDSLQRQTFLAYFPSHRVVDVRAAPALPLWRAKSAEEFLKLLFLEKTK